MFNVLDVVVLPAVDLPVSRDSVLGEYGEIGFPEAFRMQPCIARGPRS